MDKLAAMATFVAIIEHGSLTAAAQALGKAQPTMVRTLANLESHLGVRLLRRTTRRLALTAEGQDFLERCRRILADVDEAERVLDSSLASARGSLRVTAPVTFGQLHVMPVINEFLAQWPEVGIDLLLLDRPVNLLEEGIDLAVRIGQLGDSSMTATKVGNMRQTVVASPALLARTGVPSEPAALSGLPCVTFTGGAGSSHWPFLIDGKAAAVDVTPRLIVNHALSAVSACVAGVGFGRFLAYQVGEQLREGTLCRVLEPFETAPVPINLLVPERRSMSHRLRLIRQGLREALSAKFSGN